MIPRRKNAGGLPYDCYSDYTKINLLFTISVTRSRMLFIHCTQTIGSSALSFSVTPSRAAIFYTNREKESSA